MAFKEASLAREFPMRAEYRRCAWYAVLGMGGSLALVYLLRINGLLPNAKANLDWFDRVFGAAAILGFSGGLLLLLLATYRWRLRIDEMGVARRRLWGWDLWSWEEFREGRITFQQGSFVSKSRPFWRNWLDLRLLAGEDAAFVGEACKHFFRAESAQAASLEEQELLLIYQMTKSATLRKTGVAAKIGLRIRWFDWSEFQQIRLWRYDHWTHRLRKVELIGPDRTLLIEGVQRTRGASGKNYKPPAPLVIPPIVDQFFLTHAPPEKVVIWSLADAPSSQEECDWRRNHALKMLRIFTWLQRIVPAVMLSLSIGAIGPNFLSVIFGQDALPHLGWRILAALLGILSVGMPPFLIWVMVEVLRRAEEATLALLDAWERNPVLPYRAS